MGQQKKFNVLNFTLSTAVSLRNSTGEIFLTFYLTKGHFIAKDFYVLQYIIYFNACFICYHMYN